MLSDYSLDFTSFDSKLRRQGKICKTFNKNMKKVFVLSYK